MAAKPKPPPRDKPKAPPTVSTVKLSDLLRITPRRCNQLAEEGILVKVGRGRWKLLESLLGRIRDLEAQVSGSATGELREFQTRLTKAKAELAEGEAARAAAELVPLDEVEKTWATIVSRIRQQFSSHAGKAATVAHDEETIPAARDKIQSLVDEALEELADSPIYIKRDYSDRSDPANRNQRSAMRGTSKTAAEADG